MKQYLKNIGVTLGTTALLMLSSPAFGLEKKCRPYPADFPQNLRATGFSVFSEPYLLGREINERYGVDTIPVEATQSYKHNKVGDLEFITVNVPGVYDGIIIRTPDGIIRRFARLKNGRVFEDKFTRCGSHTEGLTGITTR